MEYQETSCDECPERIDGSCPKRTIAKKEFRPNPYFPGHFTVWYFIAETQKWVLSGSSTLETLQAIYGNQPINWGA